MSPKPLRVVVTGAAGQIAYSLLPHLINGSVFGPNQSLILQLLDIESALGILKGVVMELEDCSSHLLHQISMTSDPQEAFQEADYAILLGAMPRKEGMLRKDLLRLNAGIFKVQGEAINQVAKKSVKVLVVGNPANTNAMICSQFAPTIPSYQFTALTKLDENRAVSLLAQHFQVQSHRLRNVCIWGNHSNTQFPDIAYAEIEKNEIWVPIPPLPDTFTSFQKSRYAGPPF
ncbi:hypothetical protein HMI55_001475 [Coelomomyces lativittatus]|nr:hypothetical protein HMI55_001475 [Coelomomyces lativittatus]